MIRFSNEKPRVGDWTITIATGIPYEMGTSGFGWRWFRFGIYRLNEELPEGVSISDHDYTGFIKIWFYWLPFTRR